MEKPRVVPMRLFANWETDRATSSAVQRVFTTSINRLVLHSFPPQLQTQIVITTKLLGSKRSLRSNAFAVSAADGRVDVNLDISFTVQYPHFLKRKNNCLQVLIQRRRKVKNRPIPAGFKTIAVGLIDLTQCLQQDILREILLWSPEQLHKDHENSGQSVGRLFVGSCQSQPLEGDSNMGKERPELSEEEEEDDDDLYSDHVEEPSSARSAQRIKNRTHTSRDKIARKNFKQKIGAILRRFKVPDDDGKGSSGSIGRQPTAQELEELFNEFDDFSDSGPEFADADQLSIQSNPRPGLRPYFSREVLSVIYDPANGALLDDSEEGEESSSDAEVSVVPLEGVSTAQTSCMPHSITGNSITLKNQEKKDTMKTSRNLSVTDQLSALLLEESPARGRVWLSDSSPALSPTLLSFLGVVDCRTDAQAKAAVSLVVNKIQQFCNSNSRSPPVTVLGVLGGDRLVSSLLRAYVESLQNKASGDWLMYLRFAILPPPNSLVGRLLAGADPALDQLSRDVWERPFGSDWTPTELKDVMDKLDSWTNSGVKSGGCLHLPIGEVMLQMTEKNDKPEQADNSRVFLPFLAEVRVGQVDEEETASPRLDDVPQPSTPQAMGASPPASPHSALREIQEMQVEYWIGSASQNENVTVGSAGKKERGSLKSSFRALLLTRNFPSALLSLSFVKEKKKEKMLQKLGMKNRVKSDLDQAPVQVCNVSRLLGSATNKHAHLKVWVDGFPWSEVRYFQTSSQWATHVKFFPVSVPSPVSAPLPT